jgi:hypothetical protein
MLDFLNQAAAKGPQIDWSVLVLRQVIAFVLGVVIAYVFKVTRGDSARLKSLMTTLVLLTLLITTVSAVIGDNVARAFSLVGALSIVRFRTVVEDTRDTAFVILAVAVGMAIGSGHLNVPLVLIPSAFLAAVLFGGHKDTAKEDWTHRLTVRTGLQFDSESVAKTIATHQGQSTLIGVSTAKQGTLTEWEFSITGVRTATIPPLLESLRVLEGVGDVEIRRT